MSVARVYEIMEHDRLGMVEGPDIREGIMDDFRQWYMDYRKQKGKFPEFPTEEEWLDVNFDFAKYTAKLDELAAPVEDPKAKGGDKKGIYRGDVGFVSFIRVNRCKERKEGSRVLRERQGASSRDTHGRCSAESVRLPDQHLS